MNIIKKLENLKHLTPTEKVLVEFILKNPKDFIDLKPKEIASKTYVSIPTIYRLVNKLELNGINDLKIELRACINENERTVENIDYPILPTDTHYEVMLRLQDVYKQTIQDTLELADPEVLVRVASLMKKAKMMDIYTTSANIYFAKNFQFQMQEIGVYVNVMEDDFMQGICAGNSDETHLGIVISFGGRGLGIENICKVLKKNKTKIILISSTQKNPLEKYADEIIYMSSYENHYHKISSFSTRMTLLYILDTLYSIYFTQDYEENIHKKLKAYEKMVQELK